MTFVTTDWTEKNLNEITLVDCRYALQDSEAGKRDYDAGHLPESYYVNLSYELAGPVAEHGGRHPVPSEEQFSSLLESLGITKDTTVVVYDGGDIAFASRFWWLLKWASHEKVYIMEGGFAKWSAEGRPVTTAVPERTQSEYPVTFNPDMVASMNEVKAISNGEKTAVLIDSRSAERYSGKSEPIDRIGGHIPSAMNADWTEGYENGILKEQAVQNKRFEQVSKSDEIVVYCGSGITAIPNIIALQSAGYTNVRLYPGSYSDWITYEDNRVATTNEEQ